jgi:hypothetical protein
MSVTAFSATWVWGSAVPCVASLVYSQLPTTLPCGPMCSAIVLALAACAQDTSEC